MPFLKRLGFFLVGLAIGLVFLAFFLKKKNAEFCYMPNCRVLKELRSKPLSYSDAISRQLSNRVLDTADIRSFLSDGDIDFGDSETRAKPCKIYRIEGEQQGRKALLTVQNCDSLVVALELKSVK